jgi:transcriptional regulator with XRE-family HTH domain
MSKNHPTSSLGARLKSLLKARGMSQSALAARAGIDRAELNRLVNDRRPPRLDEISWVAEALGVPIEELIGDLEGLPSDLRRPLGLLGELAHRVLRAEREREEALAQVAALKEELARERQSRQGQGSPRDPAVALRPLAAGNVAAAILTMGWLVGPIAPRDRQ